jgi:mannose-6-phosphate isomerase
VSDFNALVGFRNVEEITSFAELLIADGAVRLAALILDPLQGTSNAEGLKGVLQGLVGQPDDSSLVEEVAHAAAQIAASDGEFATSAHWLIETARLYPARPDVVATLLLNLVHLNPGQAIYIAPGQVHCYLGGVVIEIMASSDNVVRGGLTPKHVDAPLFLSMMDVDPGVIGRIAGVIDGAITTWRPPIDDFILSRITLGSSQHVVQALDVKAPMVLFAISQSATISRGAEEVELKQGESLFVAPGSAISISGDATLWCASCGVG